MLDVKKFWSEKKYYRLIDNAPLPLPHGKDGSTGGGGFNSEVHVLIPDLNASNPEPKLRANL